MQSLVHYLQSKKSWKVSGFSIVSYSFGGLLAGFIANEDAQEKFFNFDKIVMLNPAVDIGQELAP